MKILVCITNVPDTTAKISFTDNNTKLNKAGVQYIIGPYDDYALARAVELKEKLGGSITVLNVGKPKATLKSAKPWPSVQMMRYASMPSQPIHILPLPKLPPLPKKAVMI